MLVDLFFRSRNSLTHYSDEGVLPRSDAFDALSPYRWSILFANGAPEFVNFFFLVGILSSIAMILGWRTRVATVLLWVIVMSVQSRNPHLSSGADTLMRVSLFWAIFLPIGARWSLDSFMLQEHHRGDARNTRPSFVSSIATFGLILQVACVYLFTAIQKDGPRWREEGSALYFALGARDVSSDLGNWLFHNAPAYLLKMMTFGSLLLEFAIPVLLLLPFRVGFLRTTAVLLLVSLHLGIAATMTVGLFPAISVASAIAVLPTQFWETAAHRFPSAAKIGAFMQRFRQDPPGHLQDRPRRTDGEELANGVPNDGYALHFLHTGRIPNTPVATIIGNTLAAIAIVIVLAWNIQTVTSYSTPQPIRQAAISSGLYQNWSMFAPGPQTATIWFVVEGDLESGEKVDLLIPIASNDVSRREPVVWDQSNELVLKDKYWRKYFHAIRGRKTDSLRFAAYTCRTWNAENSGEERLVGLTLTRGVASTRPDGERAEPSYSQMGEWTCT